MSGFDKNSWDSYLNGGTSHYNFNYRSEEIPPLPNNGTVPVVPIVMPKQNVAKPVNLSKKNNGQTGGKRKRNLKKKTMKKSYKK
jgi:hypothetical protein